MKTLISSIFALFCFTAQAQFSTPQSARNTNPLSQIVKVQFDSLTKVVTVFDKTDSWDFKPITAHSMRNGYEVTAKSGFEKIYFVMRFVGNDVVVTAYDAKSLKEVWAIK